MSTFEEKLVTGLASGNPERVDYWRRRMMAGKAYTRKRNYIQFAAGQSVRIVSRPFEEIRNGKRFRSGGQGKAYLIAR